MPVYPRACGGTCWTKRRSRPWAGLSPRLRGNHLAGDNPPGRGRSIPAPAGEPATSRKSGGVWTVYPRACGGTTDLVITRTVIKGLSPRLRGNRGLEVNELMVEGSIPAPAGEPHVGVLHCRRGGVYPRACGGTPIMGCVVLLDEGLSPRLRGNRGSRERRHCRVGSIPRACGGTGMTSTSRSAGHGLSPRLRGNRLTRTSPDEYSGSIPAPAGEPDGCPPPHWSTSVYPRACGGTLPCTDGGMPASGLSPRLRGNLAGNGQRRAHARSIPAPAGEPSCRAGNSP